MATNYEGKVHSDGPDDLVVESGGVVTLKAGASIVNEGDLFTAFDVDNVSLEVALNTMSVVVDNATIEIDHTNGVQVKAAGLDTSHLKAAAAIARTQLAEEALAVHTIPLSALRQPTGVPLAAIETAGTFNVAIASHVLVAKGEVTDNETEVSVALAEFVLPDNYVAGGDITVRLRAELLKSDSPTNNGSTLDVAVYKQGDNAVGSDLSTTTAAATFAALDTFYSKDFVITPAGLVAGDRLTLEITSSIIDSEAGAGTIICTIAEVAVLCDVQG